MFCKNCGADVGDAKFCHRCGANIGENANQKRFCSNCGAEVGESKFCSACGAAVSTATVPHSNGTYTQVIVKRREPLTRSFSFILFAILGGLLIAMMFINFFGTCHSYRVFVDEIFDEEFFNSSLWHVLESELLGIIAIILFALPIIFSFINFFTRNKTIAIINTVVTSVSFVYTLIISLIFSFDHFYAFEGYLSATTVHRFESLGIGFYLILAVNIAMCCISVFDTINKPLIKAK